MSPAKGSAVSIYMTEAQKKTAKRAAKIAGQSRSEFIVSAAIVRATEMILADAKQKDRT